MKITLLTGKTFDFSKEFDFNVKVKKSSTAKKLVIRIDEKNRCPVLSVPKYCSQKQALNFLRENEVWIVNMLARLPQKKDFENGEEISFWGKKYVIVHDIKHKGACFENSELKIGGDEFFLHRRVKDFLKKQATDKLAEMSLDVAKKLGVRIVSVSIKDTKSRWGSCSTKGNINYNWRIVLAPIDVIEYLVCHEVCHLKHPNHSVDFWNEVKRVCSSCEEGRRWLKIKGKDLYKYS